MQETVTLKQLKQHQNRFIQQAVPVLSPMQTKETEAFLKQVVQQNAFGLCAPIHALQDIIKSNALKNQIELGKGSTIGGEASRREATASLFGCDLRLKPSDYPVYGFLMDPNVLRHVLQDGNLIYQYGCVILKLRKQNLFARTTMTIGSSLNFKAYERKCPVWVADCKACCISLYLQQAFYRHVASGALKADQPGDIANVFDGMADSEYYELQYHGRVAIDRDVEKVYLYPITDDDEEAFMHAAPMLDAIHVPWEILSF